MKTQVWGKAQHVEAGISIVCSEKSATKLGERRPLSD